MFLGTTHDLLKEINLFICSGINVQLLSYIWPIVRETILRRSNIKNNYTHWYNIRVDKRTSFYCVDDGYHTF